MLLKIKDINGNDALIARHHIASVQQSVVANRPSTIVTMINGTNFALSIKLEDVEKLLEVTDATK